MNRPEMMDRVLSRTDPWGMLIIGGGATGAGIAVDAASRGYQVLLLESGWFARAAGGSAH